VLTGAQHTDLADTLQQRAVAREPTARHPAPGGVASAHLFPADSVC